MSHFARIKDGIVQEIIVAEQDFIDGLPDKDDWVQTSYNTRFGIYYKPNSWEPSEDQSKALRYTFGEVGYRYDPVKDIFLPPEE